MRVSSYAFLEAIHRSVMSSCLSLSALPPELLAGIVSSLDLGSVVRLARTCRAFSTLAFDHPHFSLFSATRSTDLTAFHHAVLLMRKRAVLTRAVSRNEDLCLTILACVWVLVVDRGTCELQWWSPLASLLGLLAPRRSPQWREPDKSATGRLFTRIVENAAKNRRLASLKRIRKLQYEATDGWLAHDGESYTLTGLLTSIIKNEQGLSQQDRLDLSLAVFRIAPAAIDVFDGLLPALFATGDVPLIVSLILLLNDYGAFDFAAQTIVFFAAASEAGAKSLFNLFAESFTSLQTRPAVNTSNLSISFAQTPDCIHTHVTELFAFQGVPPRQLFRLMKNLEHTSFETEFLPWLLGTSSSDWSKNRHGHIDLTWLFSHAHFHVSMLHVLPFRIHQHSRHDHTIPFHNPETLGRILEYVPIDVFGQEAHLQHPLLVAPQDAAFPVPDCARCAHLLQLARQRSQANPALHKFASGKWHVSYDPIPTHEWMAEARAVAELIESVQSTSTSDWLGYMDFVSPVLQRTSRRAEQAPNHVDWAAIRAAGLNRVPLPAIVLGCVYEHRFVDALGVMRQTEGRSATTDEAASWLHVLEQIKRQADAIQSGLDDKEHEARNGQKKLLRTATDLMRVVWCQRDTLFDGVHGEYLAWAAAVEEWLINDGDD